MTTDKQALAPLDGKEAREAPTDAFHLSCPKCGEAIDLIPAGSTRHESVELHMGGAGAAYILPEARESDELLREAQESFALLALGWRGGSLSKHLTEDQWQVISAAITRIDRYLSGGIK